MDIVLDEVELRIVGVLMEKALTQPGSYPLTLNAILLGANQKQNREPVMELQEADVARAVRRLQSKALVKQAPPVAAARANRFEHNVVEVFHWDRRDQAVMAELMLRGRQTPGELRTHAGRMIPLTDLESVTAILQGLADKNPPHVEELRREPGRSANRFRHLLSGGPSAGAPAATEPVSGEKKSPPYHGGAKGGSAATDLFDDPSLITRVAALEGMIQRLNKLVEDLVSKVGGPPDSPPNSAKHEDRPYDPGPVDKTHDY